MVAPGRRAAPMALVTLLAAWAAARRKPEPELESEPESATRTLSDSVPA